MTLALLLPDLTEGELADGIHPCDALADQARRNADLAEQEGQDEVHRAYLIGGSHAFGEAAARIDAAVADVFGVSAQHPGLR